MEPTVLPNKNKPDPLVLMLSNQNQFLPRKEVGKGKLSDFYEFVERDVHHFGRFSIVCPHLFKNMT